MTRLAWWPLSRPARERVSAAAGSTAGSGMKQRAAVISGPPAGTRLTVRVSNPALLATPGSSHQPGRWAATQPWRGRAENAVSASLGGALAGHWPWRGIDGFC